MEEYGKREREVERDERNVCIGMGHVRNNEHGTLEKASLSL